MEYITYYMAGTIATLALCALRTPDTEVRPAFILCVFWPATIVFVVGVLLMDAIDIHVDVWPVEKRFGFRKPTAPGVVGFAVTVFGNEFQVWKKRG